MRKKRTSRDWILQQFYAPPVLPKKARAFWQSEEAALHALSRLGLTSKLIGKTLPGKRRKAVPPPLERPPKNKLIRHRTQLLPNVSLKTVLRKRRSRRNFKPSALAAKKLAGLLAAALRSQKVRRVDGVELAQRVYPSGGALHAFEIYVLAQNINGLERGLYRWITKQNAFEPITAWNSDCHTLMQSYLRMLPDQKEPQAILLLAARIERVAYQYEGIAYSLLLKEAGVILFLLQLLATALHLKSCPLGTGPSVTFNRLIDQDLWETPLIAELAVGE